jgi:hypothetical protein
MKKVISTAMLFVLSLCSIAHALDTYRIGSKLVVVGDPVMKLVDLAGDPVFKEPIQDEYGAYQGERWQYKIDEHYVTFIIRNAKVSSIQESHSN